MTHTTMALCAPPPVATTQGVAADQPPLDLQLPEDYRASRLHLYPSADSFRWFVRQHRGELVKAGALSRPTGRWLVRPGLFDRVVLEVGARRATHR